MRPGLRRLPVPMLGLIVGGTTLLLAPRLEWRILGAAVLSLSMLVVLFLITPSLLVSDQVVNTEAKLSTAEVLQASNSVRGLVIQSSTAVAAILGLIFTARTLSATNRTVELNRKTLDRNYKSQTAEQFMRAVDQLGQNGAEKIEVRAGGIYALDLLAEQARVDGSAEALEFRRTIFRLLQSYLFQHDSLIYATTYRQNRGTPGGAHVDADFQAAVTVLTKHPLGPSEDPLDFYSLDLPAVDLRGAHLEGARLDNANLEWADLRGAHLKGASLRDTCLVKAQVDPEELRKASTHGDPITSLDDRLCGRAARVMNGPPPFDSG